jgi:hypothetical protein
VIEIVFVFVLIVALGFVLFEIVSKQLGLKRRRHEECYYLQE